MANQNGSGVDGRSCRTRHRRIETWNVDRIERLGEKMIKHGEGVVEFARSLKAKGFRKFPWISQGMQTLVDKTIPRMIQGSLRDRLARILKQVR